MENLLQLNLSPSMHNNASGKTKTPGDIGDSLFKGFLDKVGETSKKEPNTLSFFKGSDSIKQSFMISKSQKNSKGTLQKLDKEIQKLGIPISHLLLPRSAASKLAGLLEKQGLGKSQIDQLISSATDKNGFIQLNKLLPHLLKNNGLGTSLKSNAVIQSKDVPQVEETLFKMGLKAEEIKSIIERSVNENGELSLNKLSAGMERFFSGSISESELESLLEQFNIKTNPLAIGQSSADPDLHKHMAKLAQNPSQDLQKEIKQNIASVLSKKGIPPQEIKSFLENLNIDFAKTALNKLNTSGDESGDLLTQIFVKGNKDFSANGWTERIMEALKGNRILITKNAGKNSNNKNAKVIDLAEIMKQGAPKSDAEKANLLQQISKSKGWADTGKTLLYGKDSEFSSMAAQEEVLGTDINLLKIEKGSGQISVANNTRTNINLPEPLPKIFDRMLFMIRSGEHRSRMVITPPELGRLDLDITLKNGHLQANLGAENIAVKEIIESNLNQLKQQLSDQGFTVDSFEVMVGLENKEFNEKEMWANNSRKRSSSKRGSISGVEESPANNQPSNSSINDLSQIDVLV